jgi:hypothetical protein
MIGKGNDMNTIQRINQLSAERSRLFARAGDGSGSRLESLARVHAIDAELERLWEQRRHERAGRLEGIDALIEASYIERYGPEKTLVIEDDRTPVAA